MSFVTTTERTRASLLDGIHRGDGSSWHEFFDLYAPVVAGFARRAGLRGADLDEVIQETMLAVNAAFRRADGGYDQARGRFKEWLRGIAAHKIADVWKSRVKTAHLPASSAIEGIIDKNALEAHFEAAWDRYLLDRACERVSRELDPVVYQAFDLYAIHQTPASEVAKLLGISRNAVYINKCRALRRLREVLADLQAEESS